MLLVRRGAQGATEAQYRIENAMREKPSLMDQLQATARYVVARSDGTAVARIHTGAFTALDLAPDVSAEEARVLRLVAGLLATPGLR
jgi:hypothetical protein